MIVNSKKVRRLMREHDLQPRRCKRFVATTDSDHDGPIFPNLAKDVTADGPNQLWVADITYVAIAVGFVYVAVILDAWSRRVVGYAILVTAIACPTLVSRFRSSHDFRLLFSGFELFGGRTAGWRRGCHRRIWSI